VCYECGKPGHIARDCQNRSKATAAVEEDVPHYTFALSEENEYEKPAKPTLMDFIQPGRLTIIKNKFAELEEKDEGSLDTCDRSQSLMAPYNDKEENKLNEKIFEDMFDHLKPIKQKKKKQRGKPEAKEPLPKKIPAQNEQVCLFQEEPDEICATDEYDYVMLEGILDSGSVTHVMAPEDAPGYEVKESTGSRRGQMYTGTGGEKIANQGEMMLELLASNEHTKQEHEIRSTVQAPR
jgi:hypothetical protein